LQASEEEDEKRYSEDFSVSEEIEEDLDSFLNSSQSGTGSNILFSLNNMH
jgi:hypothetical protein